MDIAIVENFSKSNTKLQSPKFYFLSNGIYLYIIGSVKSVDWKLLLYLE